MFTGIVEELGTIVARDDLSDSARFTISGPLVTSDASHGDSIAVNGVCLTVVELSSDGAFTVDVMAESLNRSSLDVLATGSRVNLERAMAADGRFGGHIVQGHVDGTGTVTAVNEDIDGELVLDRLHLAQSQDHRRLADLRGLAEFERLRRLLQQPISDECTDVHGDHHGERGNDGGVQRS